MISVKKRKTCLLLDWGDTVMRVFPGYDGPMYAWPSVEVIDGVADVLEGIRGVMLIALATNAVDSDEKAIWKALQRAGLEPFFDRVYCFRRIGHLKPSPAFFRHVIRDLHLNPSQVVMVGDDFEGDVLGANKAGIPGIWFNERTNDVRTGNLFHTIHDFQSLPAVLEDLAGHIPPESDITV